ncbi:hypothetical protein GCM10023185_35330 [Hymenobacter saemangeumensis]|uniref:SMI1/KNR4 family protein n=1 Tax=Hymenobacter saemangeumensis TaxID=1084522 RepID=A0ABP8IPC4_9BACT
MEQKFELRLLSLQWLETLPAEEDLCAHGQVAARLGGCVLSDEQNSWTVSAAALFLLRTLTADHTPEHPVGEQLLPCCGHTMWPNETSEDVLVLGCPNGADWWVQHHQKQVQLTAPGGKSVLIPFDAYRTQVLDFVDQVEAFYQRIAPKKAPADAVDARGYELFWAEWHRRRQQWSR